jgi:hypothetical protein
MFPVPELNAMKSARFIILTLVFSASFLAMSLGAQVPGGFREVPVTDKDAIAAANYAIETQSKKEKVTLVKLVKAEVQVVAGRNYRLTMDVRQDDKVKTAQAVVWAKLDGTRELTKWEWKGEGQPKEK